MQESDTVRVPYDRLRQAGATLEVIYDAELNCYYDPRTEKYYQLV